MLTKRRLLMCAPLALVALGAVQAKAKERVIKIEARKFRFAPNVIELKKGEAVVLELTALDFPHGFSVPDLKIRADLVMGKPVQVRLKSETAGQFGFLCDNFCGSGHEEMAGTIIVKA
ncbi:cytochrome c oxidase subunit II [Duganella sp. BJB488]|uniref:cupredoxin domain-containing protein n=1 Tax=unclassified Duganella TaxID=2636909 RepID=UPI000E340CB6|nr:MULTISPECIES: cupredoxin domain-containing protein [unclassified Duganella]RFP21803.1 cytochrome c oxidase subunit II [Duganella sp. BJB489]RFP23597.1 cytochrome c oxidase subunit II [Duganella sp. BJB488]RFP38763.1 cytochrome c oxidase subunit II [Duganella sp. BJB480]